MLPPPQIVAEYTAREPRIRSIRHETNKKLPGALNTGHAAAKRTRCLKGLTPEEIYQLLLAAHILFMPPQFEGLPITIAESGLRVRRRLPSPGYD